MLDKTPRCPHCQNLTVVGTIAGKAVAVCTYCDNGFAVASSQYENLLQIPAQQITRAQLDKLRKEGSEGLVKVTNSKSISYTGKAWTEKRSYAAWLIDEKTPLVTQVGKAIQKVTGLKPRLAYWKFSTAGAYTMGYAGIPTIGFGPGDERFAHTANEHIKLGDCFTAACVYAQMIADLL